LLFDGHIMSNPTIPAGNDPGLQAAEITASAESAPTQIATSAATATEDEEQNQQSARTSFSHWDSMPGFAHINGDVNGIGYNETKVDIIAVPCPGADPVETWARDPLPEGYFEAPLSQGDAPAVKELAGRSILSPGINRHLPKAPQQWIRQGIRNAVSTARVMLYHHRELTEGLDLGTLADDLLNQIWQMRESQNPRPLFFIAHSIGGLVVKMAIIKAAKNRQFRSIMYDCHGVTFFATPHRGSSYLSMSNLAESIQHLLQLQQPLPRSISSELRLGHKLLLRMHSDFIGIASELRLWTFYETIDSQLSGSGSGLPGQSAEVQFGAPLVSIKSSLVGVRREQVYSLESDHSHSASFGLLNTQTMNTYLEDLATAVEKATELNELYKHTPMNLPESVRVEIIGFYEDPDPSINSEIRLYWTKLQLSEYLDKGPERCLEERLKRPAARPPVAPSLRPSADTGQLDNSGLNILTKILKAASPSGGTRTQETQAPLPRVSDSTPNIIVQSPSARPSVASGSHSSPTSMMRRLQSLTVPALSMPKFQETTSKSSASSVSDPADQDFSPTTGGKLDGESLLLKHEPYAEISSQNSGPFLAARRPHFRRGSIIQDLTAGFSRPDPTRRKFMWIHTPFNNPPWVKV
jgi:hypothetical protein